MSERYERQLLLEEIGEVGQRKLDHAKVLVVGAGGLGSPVLTYLTCAGVGTIRVIDHDIVSISNLNRQFFYGPSDAGEAKVHVAKKKLVQQNPEITIEAYNKRLCDSNVENMLKDIDVVVDCVDNIATRLLLNKVCLANGIPLVEGGVEGFYGFATVIDKEHSCLECMGFVDRPSKGPAPVIGVTAGIIGCIEAEECIKLILGMGSELLGHSLQYDGVKQTMKKVTVQKDPKCKLH